MGGLGGQKCKSLENLPNGWADWHQIWYTSADSSRNGHRLKQLAPRYTRGHLGGGFRGQKFKRLENLPNVWTDWHQIWYTSADSYGNGHRLKTNNPRARGSFWGLVWKIYQTAGPIGTKFGTRLRIHLGMDIG